MNSDTQIINNYFGLLNNLSPKLKLKLIEKLSRSLKKDLSTSKDKMEKSFGAWKDSRNADEIINELRNARKFNRKIELL